MIFLTQKLQLLMKIGLLFSLSTAINGKIAAKNTKSTSKSTSTKFLNATFTTESISITVKPDGTVSLKRNDNKNVVSTSETTGWSIYNNYEKKRTTLNKMETTGENEMLLSTKDGKYKVKVLMIEKERYIKFKLIHVSNDPETGGLNGDWPGNRVELSIKTKRQKDGWMLNTLLLNPMSELRKRAPHQSDNGIYFTWPYPQYNQTDKRPQPQGAVAAFGYIESDSVEDMENHDDIIKDIWASEERLPRPNRKNHMTSWTREDIDTYLDKWQAKIEKPNKILDWHPQRKNQNLYYGADVAAKYNFNVIYLHHKLWQGYDIDTFNTRLFPKGEEDVLAWKSYCNDRGITLHLRGVAGPIDKASPRYGRGVVADGLSKSAAGTLLEDVPADALGSTFLVEPDLDFHLGLEEWMLPFYDVRRLRNISNTFGGLGSHHPPYYENLSSRISLDDNLYKYTATITSDFKWQITINKNSRSRTSTTPLVDHKKGSRVVFVLMSRNNNYFAPGSRSNLLEKIGVNYAETLNLVGGGTGYDSAYLEDLGSWGLRKLSQIIYEGLDHPTTTDSNFKIRPFGHFEYQFKKVRNSIDQNVPLPLFVAQQANLASSTDMVNQAACAGAYSEDVKIRGLHEGVDKSYIEGYGLTEEVFQLASFWSDIKALLTPDQRSLITTKEDFYIPTVTDYRLPFKKDKILLTKTRAMRRPLIDAAWNKQPERNDIAPRQYLKAKGNALFGLENPYEDQIPTVVIHVMADMSRDYTDNISLMPASKKSVITPKRAEQTLEFIAEDKLSITFDNSKSNDEYIYYARRDTVGYWKQKVDMSLARGVAITLNGDGSGSTLVVSTGGNCRMYAVDVDFEGEKTVEIPNGEVCNNRYGWDVEKAGSFTSFQYQSVDRFRVFLQKVPAKTMSVIEIKNIVAMKERWGTGLIDPIITLNERSITVEGTIPYGGYLFYNGGVSSRVYDENWNELDPLPVTSGTTDDVTYLMAFQGAKNSFSVNAENSSNTWLSTRIKVQDLQNVIAIDMPTDMQKKVKEY